MDFTQMALQLWPCWLMGIIMIYLTCASKYGYMMRVSLKGLFTFGKFLACITLFRFLMFKFLIPHDMIGQIQQSANFIPLGAVFGVFWEDACHSLPLVLASRMFRDKKWYKYLATPLLAIVMASFACGHIYQGWGPAMAISLYIPMGMNLGKKHGFGTVMLGHIMYDMSTLIMIKYLIG